MSTVEVKELSAPSGFDLKIAAGKTLDLNSQGTVKMPAGSVLQTLSDTHGDFVNISYATSSYIEPHSGYRLVITPKKVGSKIRIEYYVNLCGDIDNDSHNYMNVQQKIVSTQSGTSATLSETGINTIDRGGQSRQRHTVMMAVLTTTSLDPITFSYQMRVTASPANRNALFSYGADSYMIATEIAQ